MTSLLRKLLAIVVLLAALLPAVATGIWVLDAYRANEAGRQDLAERYDRMRAIASYTGAVDTPAEAADLRRYLLGDGPPAVLAAGLQARLRELASAQGVEVQQVSDLAPVAEGDFLKVGVAAELMGPPQAVHMVIAGLLAAEPWVFAGKLQVRSGFVEGSVTEFEPPLATAIEVWGLAAVPPKAPAP